MACGTFVRDKGWHRACERYESFAAKHKNDKILLLELGVGMNTPAIIKYPFLRIVMQNKKATYACINYGEAACPPRIDDRSICINADIDEVLSSL